MGETRGVGGWVRGMGGGESTLVDGDEGVLLVALAL